MKNLNDEVVKLTDTTLVELYNQLKLFDTYQLNQIKNENRFDVVAFSNKIHNEEFTIMHHVAIWNAVVSELAERFVRHKEYLDSKVDEILNSCNLDKNVY